MCTNFLFFALKIDNTLNKKRLLSSLSLFTHNCWVEFQASGLCGLEDVLLDHCLYLVHWEGQGSKKLHVILLVSRDCKNSHSECLMCMHVCVCVVTFVCVISVGVHMCEHMQVHECVYTGQRLISGGFLYHCLHYLFKQNFPLYQKLLTGVNWTVSELQISPMSHPQNWNYRLYLSSYVEVKVRPSCFLGNYFTNYYIADETVSTTANNHEEWWIKA